MAIQLNVLDEKSKMLNNLYLVVLVSGLLGIVFLLSNILSTEEYEKPTNDYKFNIGLVFIIICIFVTLFITFKNNDVNFSLKAKLK